MMVMNPYGGLLLSPKKEGLLTPATMWVNREDIGLSEICQMQKEKYWVDCTRVVRFMESESRTWVPVGGLLEEGRRSYCLMGDRVSVWGRWTCSGGRR